MTTRASRDWLWALSEKPSLGGLRSLSALWQSIWRSWKEVRQFVYVRTSVSRDEVLSMPSCGVKRVWMDNGEEFFFSARVVNQLTAAGAYTLFSFWEPTADKWMNARELEAGGIAGDLAGSVAEHLSSLLRPSVMATVDVQWEAQAGD